MYFFLSFQKNGTSFSVLIDLPPLFFSFFFFWPLQNLGKLHEQNVRQENPKLLHTLCFQLMWNNKIHIETIVTYNVVCYTSNFGFWKILCIIALLLFFFLIICIIMRFLVIRLVQFQICAIHCPSSGTFSCCEIQLLNKCRPERFEWDVICSPVFFCMVLILIILGSEPFFFLFPFYSFVTEVEHWKLFFF